MRVTLIRHGETPGNALLRYIGSTDEPLSPRGEAQAAAIKPSICPDTVYVSALRRSARTAALLFPGAKMLADAGLNEMDFGRFEGRILVADEISPDTARFWDARTHEPLDIDRFRRDLGNVEQAYQELLHRMMGMDEAGEMRE